MAQLMDDPEEGQIVSRWRHMIRLKVRFASWNQGPIGHLFLFFKLFKLSQFCLLVLAPSPQGTLQIGSWLSGKGRVSFGAHIKSHPWNKKGADSLAEKYPKCPRIYLPNLSTQARNFWISMKKGFIGRPYSVLITIPWLCKYDAPNSTASLL